jgi:hypothetical protein
MINNRKELALINICGVEYEKISIPEIVEKGITTPAK